MNQNIYKERNSVVSVASDKIIDMSTGVPVQLAYPQRVNSPIPKGDALPTARLSNGITFRKNWRLVQLMTALESEFTSVHNNSENKQVWPYFKKFLFARPYKTLCKITIPEVKYKNIYITNPIASQVLHGTRSPVIIKAYSNVNKQGRNITEYPVGMLEIFPIKANFVAQWLSENIVSSKTYKLSLLCDRVIKASFLLVGKSGFSAYSANIFDKLNVDLERTSKTSSVSELILVGIKIIISGRILGAEIATSKTFKAGQIPNNTMTILKDRGFALAKTRSGTIGVKVIYFWSKA